MTRQRRARLVGNRAKTLPALTGCNMTVRLQRRSDDLEPLHAERAVRAEPKITVVGVGGAGGNAVNNMIKQNLEGVDFIVANTDAQALAQSLCQRRIQLGTNLTAGLGAGSRPDVGRGAAEEALDEIISQLQGFQHGVHHRRHGRRDGHRGGARDRRPPPRAGDSHCRRGHQALPLRGPAPHAGGRSRHPGTAAVRRYADHHSEPEPVPHRQREDDIRGRLQHGRPGAGLRRARRGPTSWSSPA